MNYEEALNYIHGISWTFCKPGLERTEALCAAVGNPQDSLKFVHVAGTNGKGSFCSMLSSILIKSGLNVGLYTSPYITEFNERMRFNGENISNEMLCEVTEYGKTKKQNIQGSAFLRQKAINSADGSYGRRTYGDDGIYGIADKNTAYKVGKDSA